MNDCIILPLNSLLIYLHFSHPFVLLLLLVLHHNIHNKNLSTIIGAFLPVSLLVYTLNALDSSFLYFFGNNLRIYPYDQPHLLSVSSFSTIKFKVCWLTTFDSIIAVETGGFVHFKGSIIKDFEWLHYTTPKFSLDICTFPILLYYYFFWFYTTIYIIKISQQLLVYFFLFLCWYIL